MNNTQSSMWHRLANVVLNNRVAWLLFLFVSTIIMSFFASKVSLSYEFARAIPTDNPKYQEYVSFKKLFGDDGNLLVIGIRSASFFKQDHFAAYQQLSTNLKRIHGVQDVLSVPDAVILIKDSVEEKLRSQKIFLPTYSNQQALDSASFVFLNLPFYQSMLYNRETFSYLMGVKINKDLLNSSARVGIVDSIMQAAHLFQQQTRIDVHISGLPLIRTVVAERIRKEMRLFLLFSMGLSVIILFMFFRSISTTIISMSVVLVGVIWTLAIIYLLGYKITLLTAIIPSLVVVIGIPNCIYFINKYHTSFLANQETDMAIRKRKALIEMVSKMGIVTLFCNITAAIGFAVFALTKSAILKEFGVVSGFSILLIFFISFIILPSVLSFLPTPGHVQLKYLKNRWIGIFLSKVEHWVFGHQKVILGTSILVLLFSIAGILQLKSVAYIVDDLPKTDRIYTDLKFFEKNFKGIMPLEIVIDTKKRNGLTGLKSLQVFEKIDSLSAYISSRPEMNRPLSVAEGLKFAKQGFYDNDSTQYLLPNTFDGAFVGEYLKPSKQGAAKNNLASLMNAFVDTTRRYTRISVSMADIGTQQLPSLLQDIEHQSNHYFDSSYQVSLTGTSITFLEGSKFIINGLKESILWAFLLISLCMLYLFRSFRILVCSLLPNILPLIVTAGVMGWVGVPLKPSTVLVFSVALGIAIDITIRFLINYRQELPIHANNVEATIKSTVQQTGLSIIYTSLVLIVGFVIFCASSFGGTFALGWLTSVTLLVATITNLILLPVLLLKMNKSKNR